MRKRLLAVLICLCMMVSLLPSMTYAGETEGPALETGLCEHHTQHDSTCGYTEGTAEVPCSHEHTEECEVLVTHCVHEHTDECYSEGSAEPDLCSHVCREESGCITKTFDCKHEHEETCGYVPAAKGTPCTYDCQICNAPKEEKTEEPKCICDTKCTQEEIKEDCPVCGEKGDVDGCVGTVAMMLAPMGSRAISPSQPVNGDGQLASPYEITSAEELYWFAEQVNGGNFSLHAKLMNDITINETVSEGDSSNLEEWTPIGGVNNYYNGTFDGNGYTISGLYTNADNVIAAGLFGYVNYDGVIKDVSVVNSRIDGSRWVGAICGQNRGTIENCYATSSVNGVGNKEGGDINASVGGICGENGGTIKNCYNTGAVSVTFRAFTVVSNTGGVCGKNTGTIENCYNTGSITISINSTNSDGRKNGGVCGESTGTITNCYYQSGTAPSDSKATALTQEAFSQQASFSGWDFDQVWIMHAFLGRPILRSNLEADVDGTEEKPFLIYTVEDLKAFRDAVNRGETNLYAELMNDIVINQGVLDGLGGPNSGSFEQWTPIGNSAQPYMGTFEGNHHTISGLYSIGQYAGLFGSSQGKIQNLAISDSYFRSDTELGYVGGICGENTGTIENCSNSGDVGFDCSSYVGGVCGKNSGTINNCQNYGIWNVSLQSQTFQNDNYVGGICGENTGTITMSYSSIAKGNGSSISFTSGGGRSNYVGGLCGKNSGTIQKSYTDGKIFMSARPLTNYVGGLCGYNENTITTCYSRALISVSNTGGDVGGICGYNRGEIANGYHSSVIRRSDFSGNAGGVCGKNENGTIKNCYFLLSDTDRIGGIGSGTGETTEKSADQFDSGEVAWLLNAGSGSESWAHEFKSSGDPRPVLIEQVTEEMTKYGIPVRVTIQMPDATQSIHYLAKGKKLLIYPWGYVYFEDQQYQIPIDQKTKIYDQDTTIYAAKGVDSITLTPSELSLSVGQKQTLQTKISPIDAVNQTLKWESSNDSVQVDENGTVTAVHRGDATITVTALDGSKKQATCKVSVTQPVTGITLDEKSLSLFVEQEQTLGVTVSPEDANDKTLSWQSDNNAVATVDETGKVTAKGQGVTTITVTANGGSDVKATCTVTVKQQVTAIQLDETNLSLYVGEEKTFVPTVWPEGANDKTLTWKSSNNNVATVDETGKLTAVGKGTATITVTANDGQGAEATCTVTVQQQVTRIDLSQTTLSMLIGREESLIATVLPEHANDRTVIWKSSDETVATVDNHGKVTAVGKGTAIITVTANDGRGAEATCVVNVRKKSSDNDWNLNFATNGGNIIASIVDVEGTSIDLDDYVPEREGYQFMGWYADAALTEEIHSITLTGDITVYAKWEAEESGGGSASATDPTQPVNPEDKEDPKEMEEQEEAEGKEETQETTTPKAPTSFPDVTKNDWFYDAVQYVTAQGTMNGMGDFFAPNGVFTREMLAEVIYQLEGEPGYTMVPTFLDVQADLWYADAIAWASENGIVSGYSVEAYGVGDVVTREQFASILYRYAKFKGYDTTQGGMAVGEFSDSESISDYAKPAMAWAVNTGILSGMGDGTLAPQRQTTRAEAAVMLMNFQEKAAK